jgi:transcriptional regulator with XRE-family HTH domain
MEKKAYKYSDFGQHLRKIRKLKYSDIKEFSKTTNIPLKHLYEYESGRIFPPIEKFLEICKALDRTPTYMMTPLLDMQKDEQELMRFYYDNNVREILQDPEIRNILKTALSCFQLLYYTRKHLNIDGDIIDHLTFLKDKLFNEGNFKKLK